VATNESEQQLLIDFLFSLRKERIVEFLRAHNVRRSGTRDELRQHVLEAFESGELTTENVVRLLENVEPWAKQHVILYRVGDGMSSAWMSDLAIRGRLARHGVDHLLGQSLPVVLPLELTLVGIQVDPGQTVVVTAVERREHVERNRHFDAEPEVIDGMEVERRGYVHVTSRGLLTLRWDLQAGVAGLHISQAWSGYSYDDAEKRFADVVSPWLTFSGFSRSDLSQAVKKLHQMEADGTGETRSSRVGFTKAQRRVEVSTTSVGQSLTGDPTVDGAVSMVATHGSGRLGNFFWLPGDGGHDNPIKGENSVHTVVLAGDDSRVHFMLPTSEEVVTYVLQRIRALA
jgi:hypothetical protein